MGFDIVASHLDGTLIGRVLEDDEHQEPGRCSDDGGGQPARQQADGSQQPIANHIGHGIEPSSDLSENVHHSMYPKPRNWSATCVSASSAACFSIPCSMQLVMNSSTLL